MKARLHKLFCLTALAVSCGAAADDIDLFVGAPASNTNLPNVLFIIDNTANWNQAFSNEMSALANTVALLPDDSFNIGIMFATESGSPNNNVKGGYVRAAFHTLNAQTKPAYSNLIRSLDKLADKGDGGYSALTMAEAYYYFTSGTPYAGNLKVKADYNGNTYGTAASRAVYDLPGHALESLGASRYTGPAASDCTKNYIIYISNGPNQQNSSTDALANLMLQQAGGRTAVLPLSPSGSQSNPSDEWADFMISRNIITYSIDVDPVTNGQGPGWTALLKSMAKEPSRYAAVRSQTGAGSEIVDAITRALSEIQAVNSVFASVSLPLSVNIQGAYSDQVYVGMFRPDADGLPRWSGNLKQYRMGLADNVVQLQDADGHYTVNPLTGFVTECARSFWTPSTTDNYWAFSPRGECIATGSDPNEYKKSNFPDGSVVEKGGQAHVTRSAASRTLKTCSPVFNNCSGSTDFDTNNGAITAQLLGAATTAERTALIDWARGLDLLDEDHDNDTTEIRPSVHGDVLHSRPAALNLGTQSSPKVVVIYSGNDGTLRAINGNRTEAVDGVPAGGEFWAFMPPEFYPNIKRLRDNSVQINFPNITQGNPQPKPYGIDGPIEAYADGTSSTWLYAAMRRGGRVLYAFDIRNNDPTDIRVKWKTGCPANLVRGSAANDTGCISGMTGMGQAWSSPKVFRASAYGTTPLLIFGGGYDPCEDSDPHTCTAASKGNKVYVLNAETGAIIQTLDTDRGVVADVMIVNDRATGRALYGYTADLGGNVYRIDLRPMTAANWTITKIASLGCSSGSGTCSHNRKFMFAPDVLAANGGYVLLLGSGDREKPRNYTNPVENYFFMLKDEPNNADWLGSETTNCGVAALCLDSLTPILTSANPTQEELAAKKGWYLGTRPTEQIVTSAITVYGTVTFSTHQPRQPQGNVCSSDLGAARVYNIAYANAASRNGTPNRSQEQPQTIGLSPNPVARTVEFSDGQLRTVVIGGCDEGPLCTREAEPDPGSVPTQPKNRIYWYIER